MALPSHVISPIASRISEAIGRVLSIVPANKQSALSCTGRSDSSWSKYKSTVSHDANGRMPGDCLARSGDSSPAGCVNLAAGSAHAKRPRSGLSRGVVRQQSHQMFPTLHLFWSRYDIYLFLSLCEMTLGSLMTRWRSPDGMDSPRSL